MSWKLHYNVVSVQPLGALRRSFLVDLCPSSAYFVRPISNRDCTTPRDVDWQCWGVPWDSSAWT